MNLTTNFGGLKLKNPIIIAASPATETLEGIIKCKKAGAIITKSIADYDKSKYPVGARRTHINDQGFWATSSFSRETLHRNEGAKMIKRASEQISTPIFASVTALDLHIENWLPTCIDMQNAGAKGIQMDLFYIPQPSCTDKTISAISNLIKKLNSGLDIPIMPKLNIELPAYLIADKFPHDAVSGYSFLDSLRVHNPRSINNKNNVYNHVNTTSMSSLFGVGQFPITCHYTLIMARQTNVPLCAGGGMTNAQDAIQLIMLGATTVQYATVILKNGYDYIQKLITDLEILADKYDYSSIKEIQGYFLKKQVTDIEDSVFDIKKAVASIDKTRCNLCGNCLKSAFCNALTKKDNCIEIIKDRCEGCAFCTYFCNENAISIVPC